MFSPRKRNTQHYDDGGRGGCDSLCFVGYFDGVRRGGGTDEYFLAGLIKCTYMCHVQPPYSHPRTLLACREKVA